MPASRTASGRSGGRAPAGALLALLLAALAAPAEAQEGGGNVTLWEFSPGLADDVAAQYVALLVEGPSGAGPWQLTAEDAFGNPQTGLALLEGTDLPQGYVLLATQEAADAYGLTPDFLLDAAALPTEGSGRLCLRAGAVTVECVGFGSVAPDASAGLPAPVVFPGQALTRVDVTGVNAADWALAPDLDPAQYLEAQAADDGGFADGGLDAGAFDGGFFDGGAPDAGPFDGGDAGILDGGLADGGLDGGDGGLDGGPPTGGQEGDLPDGGVVVVPGDGLGGGGIGGGEVPEPDTGGCAVAGGSAAFALLVLLLAGRRRRR